MMTHSQIIPPVDVAGHVAAAGMQVIWRHEDAAAWDRALSLLDYVPVSFSGAWIDYQLAYQRGHGGSWWDHSMVLLHDRQPCGVWPVSTAEVDGRVTLSSHGLTLMPPLFAKALPERSCKSAVQACLDLWQALSSSVGADSGDSAEGFAGRTEAGLSEWHQQVMRRGATAAIRHELFVDLALPIETIKARYRKSYRALITSGSRLWQVGELREMQPQVWDAFRELHVKVAGRVTRSARSWELQHEAIGRGDGFLVYLLDDRQNMVGGGYFGVTRDEGVYAVGAYDRTLFDKPLGHVVQHRAIESLKERGARWYRVGMRPYPTEQPAPTDKEVSIGEFKHGFATHVIPKYVLHHEFKQSR